MLVGSESQDVGRGLAAEPGLGNETGPVARRLFKALADIQYGRVADPYGWTRNFALDEATSAPFVARA